MSLVPVSVSVSLSRSLSLLVLFLGGSLRLSVAPRPCGAPGCLVPSASLCLCLLLAIAVPVPVPVPVLRSACLSACPSSHGVRVQLVLQVWLVWLVPPVAADRSVSVRTVDSLCSLSLCSLNLLLAMYS